MLLREPRVFALALDIERLALGLEVLRPDFDLRALLDLVAHAPARFDRLRELGQALRVEGVRAVEELKAGLVEIDDRHALELESVLRQAFGRGGLDALGVVLPQFVHLLERHLRRGRAQRRGEPAFESSRALSGSRVRRPRVCAATATSSRVEPTRTKNSATTSTRIRSLVISALRLRAAKPRSASRSC